MTEKITAPIAPDVTAPAPLGPLSGDWKDDDAKVYEDDFAHADLGPEKVEGVPHKVEKLPPVTRLLTAAQTIDGNSGPVMLLPADPNRKSLILKVVSATPNERFVFGSSKSDCFGGQQFVTGTNLATGVSFAEVNLTGHTGALWVMVPNFSNNQSVFNAFAVTV